MSWRLSTGLRNANLDQEATVPHAITDNNTISFDGDGGGSSGNDRILDSANGLAGFLVGDYLTTHNSVSNDKTVQLLSVAADVLEVAAGELTNEVASAIDIILASALGGSYRGIFRNCTIVIRTGTQPASADDAETGTVLCQITLSSGSFSADSPTNGLNFGQVSDGVLAKAVDEVWSGVNSESGVAGWFRIYDNSFVTGATTTGKRLDGACATSGAQMTLTNSSLVSGVTTTVDDVALSMPAS